MAKSHAILIDPALDEAENIQKLLDRLDKGYHAYCARREAEGWEGYNTEEAQMEDGWKLGYMAALQDVLHLKAGGTEWRNLIADEEDMTTEALAGDDEHECGGQHEKGIKATHIVRDSDGEPYLYLCAACAFAFEQGQDVFDLAINSIEADESIRAGEEEEDGDDEA